MLADVDLFNLREACLTAEYRANRVCTAVNAIPRAAGGARDLLTAARDPGPIAGEPAATGRLAQPERPGLFGGCVVSRGTRIRIALFLVLTAVGVTYVTANYLGFVDRVLGRGIEVHATLPTSGGLFVGSEVTYRGVKIGKVAKMTATRDGVTVDMALVEGTELPLDSPMYVHNLSAVGEQYLDFEPPDDKPPYAKEGDTLAGNAESLPVDEGDLLVELNCSSPRSTSRTCRSWCASWRPCSTAPARRCGAARQRASTFIADASAHTAATPALLDYGLTVLRTQQDERENIRVFARDLRGHRLAAAERRRPAHDPVGPPAAAREVDKPSSSSSRRCRCC